VNKVTHMHNNSNDLQMTSSVYMAVHTCHCGRNFTFIMHLTVLV